MVRPRSPSSIVDYAHRALVLGLVGIAVSDSVHEWYTDTVKGMGSLAHSRSLR